MKLLLIAFFAIGTHAAHAETALQQVIALPKDAPFAYDGRLVVTVVEVVRKRRVPDRLEIVVVKLSVVTPDKREDIWLDSDQRKSVWEDYEFEYVGADPDKVTLGIRSWNKAP